MKNKTFVLMISKAFPVKHIKAGQPTEFREKILAGEKIHTIRANVKLWEKRAEMINRGEAVLSLRQWEGKPYRSKQVEIMRLERIGVQRTIIVNHGNFIHVRVFSSPSESLHNDCIDYPDGGKSDQGLLETLRKNDGLSIKDFQSWFPKKIDGCIIHFTNFRY